MRDLASSRLEERRSESSHILTVLGVLFVPILVLITVLLEGKDEAVRSSGYWIAAMALVGVLFVFWWPALTFIRYGACVPLLSCFGFSFE